MGCSLGGTKTAQFKGFLLLRGQFRLFDLYLAEKNHAVILNRRGSQTSGAKNQRYVQVKPKNVSFNLTTPYGVPKILGEIAASPLLYLTI